MACGRRGAKHSHKGLDDFSLVPGELVGGAIQEGPKGAKMFVCGWRVELAEREEEVETRDMGIGVFEAEDALFGGEGALIAEAGALEVTHGMEG